MRWVKVFCRGSRDARPLTGLKGARAGNAASNGLSLVFLNGLEVGLEDREGSLELSQETF